MIDRKTYLVAQREFLENVRTKTFWIGIFILPVIYAIAIGVSILLKDAKEVRSYLVLDQSERVLADGTVDRQWLSREIDEQVAGSDFRKMAEDAKGDPDKEAEMQAKMSAWFESLPPDHPLVELAKKMEAKSAELGLSPEQLAAAMQGDMQAIPEAARGELTSTMTGLFMSMARDPDKRKQLEKLGRRTALSRFRQVTLEDLDIDPNAEDVEKQLNKLISDDQLFAYIVIEKDPIGKSPDSGEPTDEEGEPSRYVSNNVTDNDLREWFEDVATEVVRRYRVADAGISPAKASWIATSFQLGEKKVSEDGEEEEVEDSDKAGGFAPVIFVYLLWIAVFTAAQMLLTNTVEEKSNRLIEVLLSSVSPLQLMSGKIYGIAATGLAIVLSWVLTSIIGVQLVPDGSPLAEMDLAGIIGDPLYLASFVGYFLAGYLIYGAVLCAMGSVCNSLKEAQNLMQPVFILLIVPLIAMMFVVQEPNGTVARILTYIPLFTPFLMMNRAGGPPPAWEYVVSTILILITLRIAFIGAAKIFRVGILMTGKPPKITEVFRWLRAPVGTIAVRPEPGKDSTPS